MFLMASKPNPSPAHVYVPLIRAIRSRNDRVRDALLSLSIAEIRPTVPLVQLVDTVNELQAAVGAVLEVNKLFVKECEEAREVRDQCLLNIKTLNEARTSRSASVSVSVEAYRSTTTQLLDEVRRLRSLGAPTLGVATLVVEDAVHMASPLGEVSTPVRRLDEEMIKRRFKKRFKF